MNIMSLWEKNKAKEDWKGTKSKIWGKPREGRHRMKEVYQLGKKIINPIKYY